ncbi:MAG: hypothetical protein AB1921_09860 [Thermodesulfobacteriota bacterium]
MKPEARKDPFFPLPHVAAACIALGGCMHAIVLLHDLLAGAENPWWFYLIYGVAVPGYLASAVGILKGVKPALFFAAAGPIVGGSLIFLGFLFPASRLLILIPGTYAANINLLGFFTLTSEPVSVVLCLYMLTRQAGEAAG